MLDLKRISIIWRQMVDDAMSWLGNVTWARGLVSTGLQTTDNDIPHTANNFWGKSDVYNERVLGEYNGEL